MGRSISCIWRALMVLGSIEILHGLTSICKMLIIYSTQYFGTLQRLKNSSGHIQMLSNPREKKALESMSHMLEWPKKVVVLDPTGIMQMLSCQELKRLVIMLSSSWQFRSTPTMEVLDITSQDFSQCHQDLVHQMISNTWLTKLTEWG